MLIAFAIFLFTLVLVIWQPRGLGIGWSASIGALLALALGSVAPGDIPTVWNIVWNATATFIAVIVISLLLDEAGFFEWAALHVARWAGGDGRRLFAFCVLLGAAVSALFANDGAALILTPIVMSMLLALRFSPAATLAFVMAAGFIADSASLPLVVSNLVNIVSADYFGLGFGEYAAVMLPVNLVSVATSLLVLFLYFRRDLPPVYALEHEAAAGGDPRPRDLRRRWLDAAGPARRAVRPGAAGRPRQRGGRDLCGAAAGGGRARAGDLDPAGAARSALADRGLLAGHVPGGLRPEERRSHRPPGAAPEPPGRARRMGGRAGYRTAFRRPLVGNEQHAQRAARRPVDPGQRHRRRGARSDDLRQRHRLRPGSEDHLSAAWRRCSGCTCWRAKACASPGATTSGSAPC